MKKLLATIGSFFAHLFDGAKKTWEEVEPEVKEAMLVASKYVDIVNKNLQATPNFVLELLLKQFPGIPIEKIKEITLTVSKDLHIATDEINPDLEVMIGNIQKHLAEAKPTDGKLWAKISHAAYLAIAVFLAPPATKISIIISLGEYVYHDIIKGGKD